MGGVLGVVECAKVLLFPSGLEIYIIICPNDLNEINCSEVGGAKVVPRGPGKEMVLPSCEGQTQPTVS